MEILIFKTNVTNKKKVSEINSLLKAIPAIKQWNFDLDDCDKILRIVGVEIQPDLIELLLNTAGFNCQELEY
jgi:cell fate (sporulation/competence/biofilm development) regulator YmcA (YheA/YmcA/DUF963 family)